MTPDQVREVQMLLNGHGYGPLQVDGDFGNKTLTALKLFQSARGLTPDGVVGDKTREALRGPKSPPPTPVVIPGATGGLVITASDIQKIAPGARNDLVDAIVSNVALIFAAGVSTKLRAAYFLGQIITETGGLKSISESLNYSTTGLRKTFGRHRISDADVERYGRKGSRPANQEAIANLVYGGEWGRANLGNIEPGDGWRFRGASMMQTTGRANFRRAGHEDDPETLRIPIEALKAALKFWSDNHLSHFADVEDIVGLRKAVNGGTNGLEEAKHYTAAAKRVL
jgi:putative chitinase